MILNYTYRKGVYNPNKHFLRCIDMCLIECSNKTCCKPADEGCKGRRTHKVCFNLFIQAFRDIKLLREWGFWRELRKKAVLTFREIYRNDNSPNISREWPTLSNYANTVLICLKNPVKAIMRQDCTQFGPVKRVQQMCHNFIDGYWIVIHHGIIVD